MGNRSRKKTEFRLHERTHLFDHGAALGGSNDHDIIRRLALTIVLHSAQFITEDDVLPSLAYALSN